MKKTLTLFLLFFTIYFNTHAQVFKPGRHIICYFTRPVDTTVARSEKAIALIRTAGDTVIAYINRAKYTLDICMYDFVEDSQWFEHGNIPDIAGAINRAYARGVKIRWISSVIDTAYSPNTGLDSLNKNIPVLHSPKGGSYGIMHNKIMIIDGRSSNPNDAIVWTGCMNWEPGQIDKDANNLVIIQDSAFAHGYLIEFNQMWGDTVEGGKPNLTNSRFGPFKKNITPHNYWIDGKRVESYFSPSDSVSQHIVSAMASAKSEIDFGVFEMSYAADANEIVSMKNKGIYVAGLVDQYTLQYPAYNTLSSALGPMLQIYIGNDSLFHNKYVIIDPCDMKAGPAVLTGSHNWTAQAQNYNDENTIIIHDSTIANLFYQAFRREYYSLGGTLTQHCVPLGIDELSKSSEINIYPVPAHNYLSVTTGVTAGTYKYNIYTIMGQIALNGTLDADNTNTVNVSALPAGIYVMQVQCGNKQFNQKFVKQ